MQDKEKEIKVYYSKKIINSQRKAARKEEEQKPLSIVMIGIMEHCEEGGHGKL